MWGLFPSPLNILIPGGAKQICARPPNRGRAWVTGLLSVTGQKRIPGGVNAHRAAKTLAWDEAAFPFQHNKPRQATTASGPCSDQGVSRESEAPSRALPAPTPLHDRSVSSCALPGSCGSISRPEVGKREASAKGPAGPAGLARAGQGRKGRAGSGEERSGPDPGVAGAGSQGTRGGERGRGAGWGARVGGRARRRPAGLAGCGGPRAPGPRASVRGRAGASLSLSRLRASALAFTHLGSRLPFESALGPGPALREQRLRGGREQSGGLSGVPGAARGGRRCGRGRRARGCGVGGRPAEVRGRRVGRGLP